MFDSMADNAIFRTIDLTDGFYQILMRESDVSLSAVPVTCSGSGSRCLSQGRKNSPATLNRMVSHVLHPYRHFALSYFGDIFLDIKREGRYDGSPGTLARGVVGDAGEQVVREPEEACVCVFCAPEIRVVGCCVGSGVCADPEEVLSICSRPAPRDQK